jgi:hypothetical protein
MGHAGNDRFRCPQRHANATFFFTQPMCSEISACAASAEHLKRAPPTATVTVGTSARLVLYSRNYLLRTVLGPIGEDALRVIKTVGSALSRLVSCSSSRKAGEDGPKQIELAAAVKNMPTNAKSNKDAPVTLAIVESAKSWTVGRRCLPLQSSARYFESSLEGRPLAFFVLLESKPRLWLRRGQTAASLVGMLKSLI